MNSIQFNLARVIGPTIGGLAYAALGATWCFTLNGLSYIAVIISLFTIQVKFIPAKTQQRVLSSMNEGIRFIRQSPGMSALVILAFCTTLFGFSLNGFLPVFVRDIFHRGPQIYTLLLVCSGAGSICGALIIAAIEKAKGKERLTLFILVSLGLITIGFALSKWLPLSCILLFLGGVAIMASASLMLSLAQLSTTDAMRGRVMSVYNLAFRAGIPLGALALGRIIPIVGISAALSGAGAVLVAIAATFLLIRHNPQPA
jgi:predicted MFS family arabinose efflux permease